MPTFTGINGFNITTQMLGIIISRANSTSNFGYDNLSSKFNFQGPGLKVKVNWLFLEKLCYGSNAYIY